MTRLFLHLDGSTTATFLDPKPSYSRFLPVSSLSLSLSPSPRSHLWRTRRLHLLLAPFLRQIVQNTGLRNTLGDLHTIEESDGQFSEGSGVVATRDSCHDVLTEEKERERERLGSIRVKNKPAGTPWRESPRVNARKCTCIDVYSQIPRRYCRVHRCLSSAPNFDRVFYADEKRSDVGFRK